MAKKINPKQTVVAKENSIHPWRLCSYGRHWVRTATEKRGKELMDRYNKKLKELSKCGKP